MRSSLLTFATDLLDEGLETVADRLDFYHYGLAPLNALDWAKSALPAGAAANAPTRRSENQ